MSEGKGAGGLLFLLGDVLWGWAMGVVGGMGVLGWDTKGELEVALWGSMSMNI